MLGLHVPEALDVLEGELVGRPAPALGPFATRGLALRWWLEDRVGMMAASGWLGDFVLVRTDDGRTVRVPLVGMRLRAPASRCSPPLDVEPDPPAWLVSVLLKRPCFWPSWREVAVRPGDRVRIEGRITWRAGRGGYRDAARDEAPDGELVASGGRGTITLM